MNIERKDYVFQKSNGDAEFQFMNKIESTCDVRHTQEKTARNYSWNLFKQIFFLLINFPYNVFPFPPFFVVDNQWKNKKNIN